MSKLNINFRKLYKAKKLKVIEYFMMKLQPYKYDKILRSIKNKSINNYKIKVAFFVTHSSGWKYDGVYKLFSRDPRFETTIIVCPVVNHGKDNMVTEIEKAHLFFLKKNYNVIKAYDKELDHFISLDKGLKPDIIFFTNPYRGLVKKEFYIDKFTESLNCYVNYAFYVSNRHEDIYRSFFNNFLWRNFVETKMHMKMAKIYSRNNGSNCMLTGYPGTDGLNYGERLELSDTWKNANEKLKRIIWAPHHTIENEGLMYSNFLKYYNTMIEIADEFKNNIQIAFKPHPLLKVKLYKHIDWGKVRTDNYFSIWESKDNTQLETDDYTDLFNTSDAMILDSGSFTAEYLCCGKPSLFTFNDITVQERFNEFGKLALEQHYHAYKKQDVLDFINNIVCREKDILNKSRHSFYNKYLKRVNEKPASQNIYSEICNEIWNS